MCANQVIRKEIITAATPSDKILKNKYNSLKDRITSKLRIRSTLTTIKKDSNKSSNCQSLFKTL